MPLYPIAAEHIPGRGDVILSGDPDGGRPDLSGILVKLSTFLGLWKSPLLPSHQPALRLLFLEPAPSTLGSRFLGSKKLATRLESLRPPRAGRQWDVATCNEGDETSPEHYRFLMVRHQDNLWERHRFEGQEISTNS